jgi:hypothetical protein
MATGGGSGGVSTGGGEGGVALTRTIGSCGIAGGAGGGGGGALSSGCALRISSSRYSAVILSRVLDGTFAAMPSDFAKARISLFSRPSFYEMS